MTTAPHSIDLERRVHPSAEVLVQAVGEECVLLDLASESYFGLDEVGTSLWEQLNRNPALRAAHEALLVEFDVDAAQLEADLVALVASLADARLVTIE